MKKLVFFMTIILFYFVLFSTNCYAIEDSYDIYLNSSMEMLVGGGVTITSNDPSIVRVEGNTITGIKVGTTTITLTKGDKTETSTINVKYRRLYINSNYKKSTNVNEVFLVMNVHENEQLIGVVNDGPNNIVEDAVIEWESSDESVATIDKNTGLLKAVKPGYTKITAKCMDLTATSTVTVINGPEVTDFSDATYELTELGPTGIIGLKIRGIAQSNADSRYYYIVTSSDTKPEIATDDGGRFTTLKTENSGIIIDKSDGSLECQFLEKYFELNQELYLWVIQSSNLEKAYYNEDGKWISYANFFVVEAKKIERIDQSQNTLDMGIVNNVSTFKMYFNLKYPTVNKNRKFTLKIGEIAEKNLLNDIKNEKSTSLKDLIGYAKYDSGIYKNNFTTTDKCFFNVNEPIFDGKSLLKDKCYYYIYVQLDDEDGKYYPIERATIAQADKTNGKIENWWTLYSLNDKEFNWEDIDTYIPIVTPTASPADIPTAIPEPLTPPTERPEITPTAIPKPFTPPTERPEITPTSTPKAAPTTTPKSSNNITVLPYAGASEVITTIIFISIIIGVIAYIKYKKIKDI